MNVFEKTKQTSEDIVDFLLSFLIMKIIEIILAQVNYFS